MQETSTDGLQAVAQLQAMSGTLSVLAVDKTLSATDHQIPHSQEKPSQEFCFFMAWHHQRDASSQPGIARGCFFMAWHH